MRAHVFYLPTALSAHCRVHIIYSIDMFRAPSWLTLLATCRSAPSQRLETNIYCNRNAMETRLRGASARCTLRAHARTQGPLSHSSLSDEDAEGPPLGEELSEALTSPSG